MTKTKELPGLEPETVTPENLARLQFTLNDRSGDGAKRMNKFMNRVKGAVSGSGNGRGQSQTQQVARS